MKELNITQIKNKLKLLGLITNEGKPISYSSFKNKASVHRYGKKYKIVFIGIPKTNLFGFYTMYNTDMLVMKEAYSLFLELVNDNIEPYTNKDVQWTNRGIPLTYSNLRIPFDEVND
jgi:hypothetical protein